MSTLIYYFTGDTKWAKVQKPDEKYNNYQVPLYPNEPSLKDFKSSGIQLQLKTDADGQYAVFRRPHVQLIKNKMVEHGPPEVFILNPETGEKEKYEGLIGNGSNVTVKVQVYDTQKGKGHRLESVLINKLVEYNPTNQLVKPAMPF